MKWIKPWMVAVALALVAAIGATAVFFAARAQHDRDSRDIRAWLSERLPAAQYAAHIVESRRSFLESSPRRIRVLVPILLDGLDQAEMVLLEKPIAEIVQPLTSRYITALARASGAFNAARDAVMDGRLDAGEIARYARLWTLASDAFEAADEAEHDLVCRARLPECAP